MMKTHDNGGSKYPYSHMESTPPRLPHPGLRRGRPAGIPRPGPEGAPGRRRAARARLLGQVAEYQQAAHGAGQDEEDGEEYFPYGNTGTWSRRCHAFSSYIRIEDMR